MTDGAWQEVCACVWPDVKAVICIFATVTKMVIAEVAKRERERNNPNIHFLSSALLPRCSLTQGHLSGNVPQLGRYSLESAGPPTLNLIG